jgi:hypothetical protein
MCKTSIKSPEGARLKILCKYKFAEALKLIGLAGATLQNGTKKVTFPNGMRCVQQQNCKVGTKNKSSMIFKMIDLSSTATKVIFSFKIGAPS